MTRPFTRTRRLSEDLLELACRLDELAEVDPRCVPVHVLTPAEQRQAQRMFVHVCESVRELVAFQLVLQPYLPRADETAWDEAA